MKLATYQELVDKSFLKKSQFETQTDENRKEVRGGESPIDSKKGNIALGNEKTEKNMITVIDILKRNNIKIEEKDRAILMGAVDQVDYKSDIPSNTIAKKRG